MENNSSNTICPLPWLHLSSHLDTTMRICCNTNGSGFVQDNKGKNIQLKDIKNVDEYFNLNFFKDIRKKMLNGEKPEICSKCFEVESYGGNSVRQGYMHHYSKNFDFISSLKMTDKTTGAIKSSVQSLDLSLSNKCNLKCIMCSPHASSIIKSDYDILKLDYSKEFAKGATENWNTDIDFKGLINQISPSLREILTTGGEPFLNKDHIKILELIVDAGHASKITLSYHTNCTINNAQLFELWNNFQHVSVHLSIDAFSHLNEYIRFNTKWEKVEEIVPIILNHPKTSCEVHTTVQALNILSLIDLYDWIKKFDKLSPLPFHIWMDHPEWLKLDVLPIELLEISKDKLIKYFNQNNLNLHANKNQIISYIERAIIENKQTTMFPVFKEKLKSFEQIRKNIPIENIIPEFKTYFH